jgi:hypothetical protein
MPLVVDFGINREASRGYQAAGVSVILSAELIRGGG